jgi:hypothetical protein
MQDVLKALRHDGISIVSIHSHMLSEQPRVLFLHYWGIGPAEELARPWWQRWARRTRNDAPPSTRWRSPSSFATFKRRAPRRNFAWP